jgi:hypothetical protein
MIINKASPNLNKNGNQELLKLTTKNSIPSITAINLVLLELKPKMRLSMSATPNERHMKRLVVPKKLRKYLGSSGKKAMLMNKVNVILLRSKKAHMMIGSRK